MTIKFENVTLAFRKYNDGFPSLKSYVLDFFKFKKTRYTIFKALDDLSITIKNGDRLGIIGGNGAGKSTFLKAVAGIYIPSKGKIMVDGMVAPLLEIGSGFHPELTGRENLRMNCALLGLSKKEIQMKEDEIIDFSGLREFIDMQVKYYSTGMNLRLGFSINSSIDPDILLIDEFFAGGDMEFINKSSHRIKQMIKKSRILVMVSHEMHYIREFCNRVIWVSHGKIVADGEVEKVINSYIESITNPK